MLFTNANLEHSILAFVPLRNQYPDIDRNWYIDIGPTLVQTMIFSAVYPIAEFFGFYMITCTRRFLDSGFYCFKKPTSTKQVSKDAYVNLYGGPVYSIFYKYPPVILQIFVSFLYGMFLPILFPIALMGLINLYFVESLSMAYYYREPPMYDKDISQSVLEILKFAPILMFTLGYWAMGNRQIFYGDADTIDFKNQVPNPGHPLFSFKEIGKIDHTHMILCLLICLLILTFNK